MVFGAWRAEECFRSDAIRTSLKIIVLGTLVAAGLVVFSVWIEDRHPSEDAKRALLPAAQRVVTKPVVNILSRLIERQIQRRSADLYLRTGLTLEETIARFLDERVDLITRRNYAYRLAYIGSPECVAALLHVFQTAPIEHKAFMAELIGSTGSIAARDFLLPLIDDPDERVALAAIRGLSARGMPAVSDKLAALLNDSERSTTLRVAAARGLGEIGDDGARQALATAFDTTSNSEVAAQILDNLGKFPFPIVADWYDRYLASPDTPAHMRVAAVESLANSTPETVPFLLEVAGQDADADVRASAAWAISNHPTVTGLAPELAALTEREADQDVRRRLYEAMLPQAGIPADRLMPTIMAEADIAARVAGFNAVGRAVRQSPTSGFAVEFNQKVVPELLAIATSSHNLNIQMRAVFALRRAQTPAAQSALAEIANSARPQVAAAARNGLPGPSS